MSFNNGNERRKLNAKWEQLRVQYREAGMSEEAIQAMYEFDLSVLNSEHAYAANTVAVGDSYNDDNARKAADLKQYEAAITVTDFPHNYFRNAALTQKVPLNAVNRIVNLNFTLIRRKHLLHIFCTVLEFSNQNMVHESALSNIVTLYLRFTMKRFFVKIRA